LKYRASFLNVLLLAAAPLGAATFTVDGTGDDPDAAIDGACATAGGECTLRAAIQEANAAVGPHTIAFAIPGVGPHTITLGSALPSLSRLGTTIDGYTQPGTQANTNATGPLNSVILIEVGNNLAANCIGIVASDVVIRGLAVRECNRGIVARNNSGASISGVVIAGNYIGTDASGTIAAPNDVRGVELGFSQGGGTSARIGGTAPEDRNLISGNATGFATTSNFNGAITAVVQGNLVGLGRTGGPLPNDRGFDLYGDGPTNVMIGGLTAESANEIAWNGTGVRVPLGNLHITIRGNSIHDNTSIGIDLGVDAIVTPNDPGDADTGANGLQNFPVLSSVTHLGPAGAGSTQIQGVLHSMPSTTYDLDFYANPACSNFPREFLEGQTYLGSSQVTTDGNGDGPFDVTLPVVTEVGARISATATDPLGNTSEFSQRLPFSVAPASGAPAGGTTVSIHGTDFADGATVTIGGQPATGVSVTNSKIISAMTPALGPGTANDLVVTNADGTTGTLVKGWVSNFLDVPSSNQFYSFVTTLVSNAITAGIGGGLYGVNDNTLRQQMAVFLLKAKYGLCYVPPQCTGTFLDVPCPSTFASWIEALAAEGITGGCGNGNYCPQDPVRRDQMAVFLLKTEHGSGYVPPMCAGTFADVACPSTFANWIEQLAAEAITGGCGGGNYCPGNPNTRGQMAVFITKTFNLQ
jgi:CSLREA domain-containing protein